MILHTCGDRALLAEYANLAETMAHFASLRETAPDDVEDLVPAARTVLVRHNGDNDRVAAWIRASQPATDHAVGAVETVTISVTYDGEDLDDVADATGIALNPAHGRGDVQCLVEKVRDDAEHRELRGYAITQDTAQSLDRDLSIHGPIIGTLS